MGVRKYIRLVAAILIGVLLCLPVCADTGERLAVERSVFDYLTTELNLSTAAACGVLANIEHESNFSPTVYGDRGTSYGLCQWHNSRFAALRGYCTALGLDYQTVEGQMAYLRYELGNRYTSLLLTLQSIDNTPDGAYRAAYLWCTRFEMPSNMEVKAAQRGELARGKYWNRYSSYEPITLLPEPEEPEIEDVIEDLRQHPVAIPLPPEEEEAHEREGYEFQKPPFRYYTPRHLPADAEFAREDFPWEYPALGIIAGLALMVWFWPVKKKRKKN